MRERQFASSSLMLTSHSSAQTQRMGAGLGRLLREGDIICLEGELGTGKTCFIQGVGRGMGIRERITSPSFTLIREYVGRDTRLRLYHIDLYRIEEAMEASRLGLDDYLYDGGVCAIEWAERAREIMPQEHLWITLRYLGERERTLAMEAKGRRYKELLAEWREDASGH